MLFFFCSCLCFGVVFVCFVVLADVYCVCVFVDVCFAVVCLLICVVLLCVVFVVLMLLFCGCSGCFLFGLLLSFVHCVFVV